MAPSITSKDLASTHDVTIHGAIFLRVDRIVEEEVLSLGLLIDHPQGQASFNSLGNMS